MKLYKMLVGGFETKEIKKEYTTTYNQVGGDREEFWLLVLLLTS